MYQIPKQSNILEQVGQFIGARIVDATAIAASIGILRSGIRSQNYWWGFCIICISKTEWSINERISWKFI